MVVGVAVAVGFAGWLWRAEVKVGVEPLERVGERARGEGAQEAWRAPWASDAEKVAWFASDAFRRLAGKQYSKEAEEAAYRALGQWRERRMRGRRGEAGVRRRLR